MLGKLLRLLLRLPGKVSIIMASIVQDGPTLVVSFRYNSALVQELKTKLPYNERRWDNERKAWLVDIKHGQTVSDLLDKYLGVKIIVPAVFKPPEVVLKVLEVRYLGVTKPRDDGFSAFGWVNGEWSVIFPENVLKEWFEGITISDPGGKATLYSVLMLQRSSSGSDVKSAYRRLARQWHPDVCKENNATEQFMAIKHAYEILSNPKARARYDAGLALEASLGQKAEVTVAQYRAPLRCGHVLVEGQSILGRFVVGKILAWEDIVDNGKTLVTSWPYGANTFVENWV